MLTNEEIKSLLKSLNRIATALEERNALLKEHNNKETN